MKGSAILPMLYKQAIVEKVDGKWVLWTRDKSRRLGTHDTAHEAYAQEAAIQHSQERRKEASPVEVKPAPEVQKPAQLSPAPIQSTLAPKMPARFPTPVSLPAPKIPAPQPVNAPPAPFKSAALQWCIKQATSVPMYVPSGEVDENGVMKMVPNPAYTPDVQAAQTAAAPADEKTFVQRHGGFKGMLGEFLGGAASLAMPGAWLAAPVLNAGNWARKKTYDLQHNWDYYINGKGNHQTYVPKDRPENIGLKQDESAPTGFWDALSRAPKSMMKDTGRAITDIWNTGSDIREADTVSDPSQAKSDRGFWVDDAKAPAEHPMTSLGLVKNPTNLQAGAGGVPQYHTPTEADLMEGYKPPAPVAPPVAPPAPAPKPVAAPKLPGSPPVTAMAQPTVQLNKPVPNPAAPVKTSGWLDSVGQAAAKKFHLFNGVSMSPPTWGDAAPGNETMPLSQDLDPTYNTLLRKALLDPGRAPGHPTGLIPSIGAGLAFLPRLYGQMAQVWAAPAAGAAYEKAVGDPRSFAELRAQYLPKITGKYNPYHSDRFDVAWDKYVGDPSKNMWNSAAKSVAEGFGPLVMNAVDQYRAFAHNRGWEPHKQLSDLIH